MHYLGIDYGDRWVGLATGDDETRIASPLVTIEKSEDETLMIDLEMVILSEGADCIVVGMPVNPSGSGEQQERTKTFIESLRHHVLCPVREWNEQFTSQEARGRMRDGGGDEHAIAAMLILQSYLDADDAKKGVMPA